MNTEEFDKLWRLFASLFPAAVKKRGPNAKEVWERAMTALGLKGIEANYPKNISVDIEKIFKTCLAKVTLPLAE